MARRGPALPSAAFLLHRYDWSETSLILDLFTRDQGRVVVAAKGAKRPYSQLRPVLLPFQKLHTAFSRPKADPHAEVLTLRSAEWAGGTALLPARALFAGFYLNELLMRLLARNDPHAALFDTYAATLPALAQGNDTLTQAALRAFELVLLREMGLLPRLDMETTTARPVQPDAPYTLRPAVGLVAPPGLAEVPAMAGQRWQRVQTALDDGHLADVQRACADDLPVLKAVLRTLLHDHLGHARLRTREVMLDAQQWMEQRP